MNFPYTQHPYYYHPYPFHPPPPPPYPSFNPISTVYKLQQTPNHSPPKKKRGRPKNTGNNSYLKSKQSAAKGHWDTTENKRYHLFLEMHSNHFINKGLRRADKIFKTMAKYIGTRIAEQCRSHHQKMQKKYGNFILLLRGLRTEYFEFLDASLVERELQAKGEMEYDELLGEEVLLRGELGEEKEIKVEMKKEQSE